MLPCQARAQPIPEREGFVPHSGEHLLRPRHGPRVEGCRACLPRYPQPEGALKVTPKVAAARPGGPS
ncbi:hypothetical protein ACFPRL_18460 [Pseudoclavibacter helvolus]